MHVFSVSACGGYMHSTNKIKFALQNLHRGIGLEHIYQPKYIAQRENIVSLGKNKRWMEGGIGSGMFLLRKYQKMGLKLIFLK